MTPEEIKFSRDKREEAHEKIRLILQEYHEWFQPDEDDQNEGWDGPFLLNNHLLVVSYLDSDNDEWVGTFRPLNMTQSQRDGMMYRALHI